MPVERPRSRHTPARALARHRPVILMGRGHSGTYVLTRICTLLGLTLGTRSELLAGDAADRIFTEQIKKIARNSLSVTNPACVSSADTHRLADAASRFHTRISSPTENWGWRFPETYLIGPCIESVFPQARYLHLIRDGRDIAFKHHLTDDPNSRLGKRLLKHIGALELSHYLRAASSWAFQVNQFDAFRMWLPKSRVFDIRFEDICLKPVATISRLCDYLEVKFNEEVHEYVDQQLDRSNVAQHREHTDWKVAEVVERILPTLERYRYVAIDPPPPERRVTSLNLKEKRVEYS